MKVKKKTELSHYPRVFFSQLMFRTVSWAIFSFLFIFLGRKYAGTDMLGKMCQSIWGGEHNFNQYFLGANEVKDKQAILNYAIYFLVAIIILNIISLAFNSQLWKKDKYIENNQYYLHNKWIFILNSLLHVASAFLLIFSLVSPFTLILTLLFITFNTRDWSPRQKKLKNPQTENFFSWKNQYVRQILFYSVLVVLVVPLIIGRLRNLVDKAKSSSPSGLAKTFNDLLDTSPTFKKIIEMLTGPDFGLDLLYWFILFWFTKGLINGRWKEFADFWTQVNNTTKRVSNFRHHYYYQESWALANNKIICLGDYNYLENNPNFLKKDYLESDLDIEVFAKNNRRVIKHIEFCATKVKEPAKINFLNYCLFNEFNSWEDCLRTRRLLVAAGQK